MKTKPKIKSVLLAPFSEKGQGLLGGGPCGSKPPRAFRCKGMWYAEGDGPDGFPVSDPWGPRDARALVLVWDGKTVQAGVDAATEAAFFVEGLMSEAPALGDRFFHPHEIVEWVGECLAEGLECRLVMIEETS